MYRTYPIERLDNDYIGHRLAAYVFLLVAVTGLVRSCIHILAPDGGTGSLAGMDLSVAGADAIIFAFGLWGSSLAGYMKWKSGMAMIEVYQHYFDAQRHAEVQDKVHDLIEQSKKQAMVELKRGRPRRGVGRVPTDTSTTPWQRLTGKIAPEVLVAPKTWSDPRNKGEWPEVEEQIVAYLENNVIGKQWADYLALAALVMTARSRIIVTTCGLAFGMSTAPQSTRSSFG